MGDHFADDGKMVCFRGVTKMYAAGKHFVEINKMLTAEVLRPAGAARSKGWGCCPTSSCSARGRVYTGPLLARAAYCIYSCTACDRVFSHDMRGRVSCLQTPEGHTDFETKSSVLHLARRGVWFKRWKKNRTSLHTTAGGLRTSAPAVPNIPQTAPARYHAPSMH